MLLFWESKWLAHITTSTKKMFHYQKKRSNHARGYLHAKNAATYTLSSQRREPFKMFKAAIKTWPTIGVIYTANLKQHNYIDIFSDDGFDCSISWHYSDNAAEQRGKLLEVGLFKRWSKRVLLFNTWESMCKDDNGSNEMVIYKIKNTFRQCYIIILINMSVWYLC